LTTERAPELGSAMKYRVGGTPFHARGERERASLHRNGGGVLSLLGITKPPEENQRTNTERELVIPHSKTKSGSTGAPRRKEKLGPSPIWAFYWSRETRATKRGNLCADGGYSLKAGGGEEKTSAEKGEARQGASRANLRNRLRSKANEGGGKKGEEEP